MPEPDGLNHPIGNDLRPFAVEGGFVEPERQERLDRQAEPPLEVSGQLGHADRRYVAHGNEMERDRRRRLVGGATT